MKVLGGTKVVGIVAYNGGIINEHESVEKVKKGIPPLIHPMWQ
jgi:hypothetical protein